MSYYSTVTFNFFPHTHSSHTHSSLLHLKRTPDSALQIENCNLIKDDYYYKLTRSLLIHSTPGRPALAVTKLCFPRKITLTFESIETAVLEVKPRRA